MTCWFVLIICANVDRNRPRQQLIENTSTPKTRSGLVKDLLDRLPPRWLSRLAVLRSRNHRFLEPIRHLPPLPNLGVLPHLLHIAFIVVADIFEVGKEDASAGVVEDAVCASKWSVLVKMMVPA